MRRIMGASLIIFLIFAFGCTKEATTPKPKPLAKVGLYLPPFEDYFYDYYDLAQKGINDVKKDYPIEVETIKVNQAVYESIYLEKLVKDNDVTVFMSFPLNQAYSQMTEKYPKKYIIGIESYFDGSQADPENPSLGPSNGSGIFAQEEQGGFLAGVLAGMLTTDTNFPGMNKEKKIGFIGAVQSPWLVRDLGGLQHGAWYIDPDIKIHEVWGQDDNALVFNNPKWAYKEASKLYDQGVDIIFAVGGKTTEGVYKAAYEKGKYAITMNGYKGYLAPGHILAGVTRRVDVMIYNELKEYLDAKKNKDKGIIKDVIFKSGSYKVGIAEGVIEMNNLVGMDEEEIWLKTGKINQAGFEAIKKMKEKISEKTIATLTEARNRVISGEIVVKENSGPIIDSIPTTKQK